MVKKKKPIDTSVSTPVFPRKKSFFSVENPSLSLIITALGMLTYAVFFGYLTIKKYFYYQYPDYDLATYANHMYNLTQGNPMSTLIGSHLLQDHVTFIGYLVVIPYFIFRSPVFLLILQAACLAITAYPVYKIAEKKIDHFSAAIISILFLFYPALTYLNLYEFYFETLAVPLLAFAFYYMLENKMLPFIITAALACSCKENIPLTVAMIGIYGLFRPHRQKIGAVALLMGIAWFIFGYKLIPMILTYTSGREVTGLGAYGEGHIKIFGQYGKTLGDVLIYILQHPLQIIGDVFNTPDKVKFFNDLLMPLCYIPILGADILFIAGPHVLARMIASNVQEHTIYYHSAGPVIPIIFMGFIFAFKRLFKLMPEIKPHRHKVLAGILIVEIAVGLVIWNTRTIPQRFNLDKKPSEYHIYEQLLKEIPKNAYAAVPLNMLSHTTDRPHFYSIHRLFGKFEFKIPMPQELEYVVFNTSKLLMAQHYQSGSVFDKDMLKYLNDNSFYLYKYFGEVVAFKKSKTGINLLNFRTADAPPDKYRFTVDQSLMLVDYTYRFSQDYTGAIYFTFKWYVMQDNIPDYQIIFFVNKQDKSDILYSTHWIGYNISPVSAWKKGDLVTEEYCFVMPPLWRFFNLTMQIGNSKTQVPSVIDIRNKDDLDQFGKFRLVFMDLR